MTGRSLVAAPAGFLTNTDWTVANGLPAAPIGVWVTQSCTLKLDGGGQVGIVFAKIQAGFFLFPVSNVTRIYAVGNGSTGAASGAAPLTVVG